MTDQPSNIIETTAGQPEPGALERSLPPLTPNATLRWDVVSRLLPAQTGKTLEVGCGRGAAAARLARSASALTAVEPDEQSFSVAHENLRGLASVHNCMSADLPKATRFDTICSFEVLEHIEDDTGTLREWRERLREGGTLVLSVPAFQDRFAAADELVGHLRRYDPEDLRAKLEASGYVDIEIALYGFPAGHLLEAFRNFAARRRLSGRAAQADVAERTAGSGRLLQPKRGLSGIATAAIARPMVWAQRIFPGRGVGIVARARRPD